MYRHFDTDWNGMIQVVVALLGRFDNLVPSILVDKYTRRNYQLILICMNRRFYMDLHYMG